MLIKLLKTKKSLFGYKKKIEQLAKYTLVENTGSKILNNPLTNKTTAFPTEERQRLELEGLLPNKVLTLEQQKEIIWEEYSKGLLKIATASKDSGVTPEMIRQWRVLQNLQDTDETLFYRLLLKHIEKMAPIIYTPTVGWLCKNYSRMFRKPRGMFFSCKDKGNFIKLIHNWHEEEVSAVVVTDGSRVLGLGDLGIGGLGISVGKLDLYVAAAGFHPKKVLPVVIDVGTNNQELLDDPFYLGLKQKRLEGQDYYDIIDEFVAAVKFRYPNALIQFEDFQHKHAAVLLERYREELLVFNDDIQGTAAIALSGVISALRLQGRTIDDFKKTNIMIVGAGSAGLGIASYLHKYLVNYGLSYHEAFNNFFIIDDKGLVSRKRKDLSRTVLNYARSELNLEGKNILEVVKKVKPGLLIGVSGVKGLFTKEVIKEMSNNPNEPHPIIFPLSNPTSKAEATAEEVYKYSNYTAIFGSGSPFTDIIHNKKTYRSNQSNNVYIFPGLAFAAVVGKCSNISDNMVLKAAEALSECITDEDLKERAIFPRIQNIREVSLYIAARVIEQAHLEKKLGNEELRKKAGQTFDAIKDALEIYMWEPKYRSLVFSKK